MKKYIVTILLLIGMVASPAFAQHQQIIDAIDTTSNFISVIYNGYGEISEETGSTRVNHVNSYYKSNGIYVDDHYRN